LLVFGLVFAFSLILWQVKRNISIGLAVTLGGVVLAIFAGFTPLEIMMTILETFTQKNTIQLIATVTLVNILSSMMSEYGIMNLMVEYLEKAFKRIDALLFIIPSLLSTFTASGAAIIAAPIIDGLGNRVGISAAKKAAINLYVRHAWYFILPVSVNLINASFISNIPIKKLVIAQAPISIICLTTAYLVYLYPLRKFSDLEEEKVENDEFELDTFLKAFLYTSPILICVFLVFFIPSYLALLAGSILAYIIRVKKTPLSNIIFNKKGMPLIIAAAGVMIFKNFIENIPELKILLEQIINLGIPLEVIIILMTIIASYVAANLTVVIGLMYPLILPIVPQEQLIPTATLIYTMGYATYFISPIHLCQALTNEYFGVAMKDLYKEYRITVPVMYVTSLITNFFIRFI
jgi:integral membrane protein (TIGR00529 family)